MGCSQTIEVEGTTVTCKSNHETNHYLMSAYPSEFSHYGSVETNEIFKTKSGEEVKVSIEIGWRKFAYERITTERKIPV